jgi:hypothetical protein
MKKKPEQIQQEKIKVIEALESGATYKEIYAEYHISFNRIKSWAKADPAFAQLKEEANGTWEGDKAMLSSPGYMAESAPRPE